MDSVNILKLHINTYYINNYFSNAIAAWVDSIKRLKSISFKLVLAVNSSRSEFKGAKFSSDDLPKS